MKKFSENSMLLAATVAGMLSSTAQATTSLDDATGVRVFAKEINIESNGNVKPDGISVKAGFGFQTGNVYIRFDLDNGAKFGSIVSSNQLALSGTTSTISQGGAATDTYVVFNTAINSSITETSAFALTLDNIKVANRSPVNLRYRLYTDPSSATNAVANSLKDKSGPILKFDTALSLAAVTSGSSTASVVDNFLKFLDTPYTVATVGSFKASNANSVAASGGVTAVLSDVVDVTAGKSALVINGDFSAAFDSGSTSSSTTALARIWLAPSSVSCTTSGGSATAILKPTAIAADGKSATFANLVSSGATGTFDSATNTASTLGSGVVLCYLPNAVTPIAVSDYSVTFKPVAGTGYAVSSDITGPVFGAIKRNGAELQAPFANVITGYKSRIYLTNTSGQDAPFSMTVQSEPGTVFTPNAALPTGITLVNGAISGVIPKNGNTFLALDTLGTFTAASGSTAAVSTRGSLIFKVAADCSNIQGMFQLRNLTTGDFDSAPLLRPAGVCK